MSNVVLSAPDSNHLSWHLDLDNLDQTYAYDGNNRLTTIAVIFNAITFIQTFTRDGNGNVTYVSRFIPQ